MVAVMPLGDSITQGSGSGDGAGYRSQLYTLVTGGGQAVDFVGSESAGAFAQPEHEGHGGYTVVQLRASVATWLRANPPSVVLLCAGTNDLITRPDISATEHAERLGLLLDDIHAVNASIQILVAPIPPLTTTQLLRARAAQFNAAARREAEARALVGWVPMQWQGSDLGVDGVHPNDAGYVNFARAWHRALRGYL